MTSSPPDTGTPGVAAVDPAEAEREARRGKIAKVLTMLDEQRDGDMLIQLHDALTGTTAAVRDVAGNGGKAKGRVTVVFEIEAVKGVSGGAVSVRDSVQAKPPVVKNEAVIKFGKGGALERDPVDQYALIARPGGNR